MPVHRKAAILILGLLLAGPVAAATVDEVITAQLRAQGYRIDEVSYTLLGRIYIGASMGNLRRELVINPRTGEILRDYQGVILQADGGGSASAQVSPADPPVALGAAAPAAIDYGSDVTAGMAVGAPPEPGE